ncbi:MFS transporter [Parablastomonas sp. CN1-191]|uniref:MFS transporter n=1 Tax=Parablastomonas sp. CN1-191 TaxID=3400908 RepID=UPI003BF8BFB7
MSPSQAKPEPRDGLLYPRRLIAIVAISFGTALFVIDGTIGNVALPTIARDLKVGEGTVVSAVTIYQLVTVMVLLPFATLGDRIGHRNLYQIGQIVFMGASALTFLVHSFPALLAVRALQALGAGTALSVSAALLRQIYPARSLGSGLGINSVIVASSNAVAPVVGGFIVAHSDWRIVYALAAPFALASLLLGRSLPDPRPARVPFDWRGGLWSAGSVALLVGGIELAAHAGQPLIGTAIALAGLVSGGLLARREMTRERPVLPVDLLVRPVIGLSIMAATAGFIATSSLIVALPFRFEQGFGLTPQQVGIAVLPFPLTLLVVAPLAGWLSDRIKASILGLVGMAVAICGLATMALLPAHPGMVGIAWRLALCAAGFGLFFAPNARLIIGGAPKDRAAAAGGIFSTARLLGQTLGAAWVGVVLALGWGLGPAPFLAGIALCAVAGVCSLVRLGKEPEKTRGAAPA